MLLMGHYSYQLQIVRQLLELERPLVGGRVVVAAPDHDAPLHRRQPVSGSRGGAVEGQRALEKRPVAVEAVESELAQIKNRLRATGERELDSRVLGELVMEALKRLDQVAFVRFASVYRSFEDLSEFRDAIASLEADPQT